MIYKIESISKTKIENNSFIETILYQVTEVATGRKATFSHNPSDEDIIAEFPVDLRDIPRTGEVSLSNIATKLDRIESITERVDTKLEEEKVSRG